MAVPRRGRGLDASKNRSEHQDSIGQRSDYCSQVGFPWNPPRARFEGGKVCTFRVGSTGSHFLAFRLPFLEALETRARRLPFAVRILDFNRIKDKERKAGAIRENSDDLGRK